MIVEYDRRQLLLSHKFLKKRSFHKTLPKFSVLVHWITARNYEMACIKDVLYLVLLPVSLDQSPKENVRFILSEQNHIAHKLDSNCSQLLCPTLRLAH